MIRPKIRKLIRTEWKLISIVDFVENIHYTKKPNNPEYAEEVTIWEKKKKKKLQKPAGLTA